MSHEQGGNPDSFAHPCIGKVYLLLNMYMPTPSLYYCIDVECVATGTDHNARAVGQISLVVRFTIGLQLGRGRETGATSLWGACLQNQFEQVLFNEYVVPDKPIVSYLTPLTG
jgi:hypothetical protein